jgi:ParB-like chromosome segregation protein Spo0J
MTSELDLTDLPQPSEETTVAPESLSVDGDNPNSMEDDVFDLLVSRIEQRGWVGNAIIVDEDGVIADGEHRWRAALELGLTEVPVKRYDLSDEERRLLRQELNKIEGEHDRERDAAEYDALLSAGFVEDIESLTSAKNEDLEGMLNEMQEKQVSPDEVDEMSEEREPAPGAEPALDDRGNPTDGTGGDTDADTDAPGTGAGDAPHADAGTDGPREAPDDPKAPPVQQEGENDPYEEWDRAGTAEDTNEDLTSEYKVHVHLRDEEDLEAFEELVGQTVPRNTWAIWYPEAERLDASDTYAVAAPEAADTEADTDAAPEPEAPADGEDD